MGDWLQDKCNEIQKAQQEHIQKSFGSEDIEKARSGVYKPTKQNLKEGIAGQKYGSEKKEEKSENEKLFNKLQKDYEDKTNDLQKLSDWKDLLSKHTRSKNYGDDNKVKSMTIDLTVNFEDKLNYFVVRPSYYSVPNYGEEADNFYNEVKSLENKRFDSAKNAAKAADEFANKINSKKY